MADPGIFLDGTLVALIVTNIGLIARDFFRYRKNNTNTKVNGKYPCGVHGEKLAKLETTDQLREKTDSIREKWLDEFKKNNTLEHEQLSHKLDQLNGKE